MSELPVTFDCLVRVDIAAQTFTAATLLPGQKPELFKSSFPQTATGFERFMVSLKEKGYPPPRQLVVMAASGPYWMALALALHQAGFRVAAVNPAQVHFFARAQLKRARHDRLDAQILAQFAQALPPRLWTPPPQF